MLRCQVQAVQQIFDCLKLEMKQLGTFRKSATICQSTPFFNLKEDPTIQQYRHDNPKSYVSSTVYFVLASRESTDVTMDRSLLMSVSKLTSVFCACHVTIVRGSPRHQVRQQQEEASERMEGGAGCDPAGTIAPSAPKTNG
jgi:hypothetical protein